LVPYDETAPRIPLRFMQATRSPCGARATRADRLPRNAI